MTCPAGDTRPIKRTRHRSSARLHRLPPADPPHHLPQRTDRQLHEYDRCCRAPGPRHRPGLAGRLPPTAATVERGIAWIARGNRRVPYRGVIANNIWLHHRAAALNLRRLITLGLTRAEGQWILATA